MKRSSLVIMVVAIVLSFSIPAAAGDKLVQSVMDGCKKELTSYCQEVTPGQGRLLACLYAHNDKLSGQCEFALYDAAVQLERAVSALGYVVNECRDDLESLCSGVPAGQGRLLNCLQKNDAKVSVRCKQALNDTGLKK